MGSKSDFSQPFRWGRSEVSRAGFSCLCELAWVGYMRERGNISSWDNSKLLDILQQFTFVIKQKEQNIDLTISNNTNRIDRKKQ